MNVRERYQRRAAVPGGFPRPGQTLAEHEAEVTAYWGGRNRQHDRRTPLTTNQHILHLLLTVVTCGLWLPVWAYLAVRGNWSR